MQSQLEFLFAECRLNVATRDLWWRGQPQRIEPRVLDFLIYLIKRRDRVVRKDELIEHVWDNEFLTDSVLARAASKARKAIGDSADGSALVRTVHRIGYRFIGDVTVIEPSGSRPSTSDWTRVAPSAPDDRPGDGSPLRRSPPSNAARPSPAANAIQESPRYFAHNDDVAAWTAALVAAEGAERLGLLVKLAWHLRQRDTRRALELADEAEALIGCDQSSEAKRSRARLMSTRGEAKWLFGQLHVAMDLAKQAALTFERCADLAGACDAALLQANIAADRDDPAARDASLRRALDAARALEDDERHLSAQLQLALVDALHDAADAERAWRPRVELWAASESPGVRAACHYVLANFAAARGDRGQRLQHAMAAREQYALVGQRRDVIRETGNVGGNFANLYDNEAALEWMTAALAEARAAGWPLTLGACLAQTAITIVMLKRPHEAVDLLEEASHLLRAFPGHRVSLMSLRYRGDVELALARHDLALASFEESLSQARARKLLLYELDASVGCARALSNLGRPGDAREMALGALSVAESIDNSYYQYLILEALAELHREHPHLAHVKVAEPSPVLHYQLRALAKQGADNLRTTPVSLLTGLAAEYARLGDYRTAYEYQARSQAAHAQAQSSEVNGRAIAMKIRHNAEQARAESEHHKALAAAHAERADALAQTNATLARLGTIGREITLQLEASAIFDTLDRHVNALVDASSLAVFLLDSGGTALELAFGTEGGLRLPSAHVALDDGQANVARCARECRQIHVELLDNRVAGIPGTLPSQSALFAPLSIGTRVLGVLTVQSPHAGAYGEREQLILRSLSAYAAVALDNAAAYHRLESARDALAMTNAELLDKDQELAHTRQALHGVGS